MLKINVFQWHLVDDQAWRLAISKYPRLVEPLGLKGGGSTQAMGYYSASDVREIVERAKNVQIDGSKIKDWDLFHDLFAEVFGFPGFYGRNMNACDGVRTAYLNWWACRMRDEVNISCSAPDLTPIRSETKGRLLAARGKTLVALLVNQ